MAFSPPCLRPAFHGERSTMTARSETREHSSCPRAGGPWREGVAASAKPWRCFLSLPLVAFDGFCDGGRNPQFLQRHRWHQRSGALPEV